MGKPPPDIPDINDRCCLRANEAATGTFVRYDRHSNWSYVEWDEGVKAPEICHRFELRKLSAQSNSQAII